MLHSSASLGTGKLFTHQELAEKAEDLDIRKALTGLSGKRKRHQDHFRIHGPDEDTSEVESYPERDIQNTGTLVEQIEQDTNVAILPIDSIRSPSKAHTLPAVVGSALQRNPDGSTVAPKIRAKSGKQVCFFNGMYSRCLPQSSQNTVVGVDNLQILGKMHLIHRSIVLILNMTLRTAR